MLRKKANHEQRLNYISSDLQSEPMSKEARHHHYIPQCYLRGFSVGVSKRSKITVADIKTGRYFETIPRNIGGVRDFNRVSIDGVKPDAIEGLLAPFEGQVSDAIRNVDRNSRFEGDDRLLILNLIALLAIRSPQQRENIRQFEEKVIKDMMGLTLATKERWEAQIQELRATGQSVDDSLSYEDIKAFHDKGQYKITLSNEHHIDLEFTGMDAILNTLVHRNWRLYTTTSAQGCFITSDHPVMLSYQNPEKVPLMFRDSPGFGLSDTEVVFPLTQNALLMGTFDGPEGTRRASFDLVAAANRRVIEHAFQQVYTPDRTFAYIGPDMQIRCDPDFMEIFKHAAIERKAR